MTNERLLFFRPVPCGCVVLSLLTISLISCQQNEPTSSAENVGHEAPANVATPQAKPGMDLQSVAAGKTTDLFDGKSLDGWRVSDFGGDSEDVYVKDGQIVLEMGNGDLTGIHSTRDLPKSNYEVTLEAMRVMGGDFFCGLTFPVNSNFCSLIVGGWGGGLCGLSSIGGYDAANNETSSHREFVNNRWYRIRLRVTNTKIEAWIDDEQIIDHTIDDRAISVRIEVEPSRPFGVATWQTTAALRNFKIRELPPESDKPTEQNRPK